MSHSDGCHCLGHPSQISSCWVFHRILDIKNRAGFLSGSLVLCIPQNKQRLSLYKIVINIISNQLLIIVARIEIIDFATIEKIKQT